MVVPRNTAPAYKTFPIQTWDEFTNIVERPPYANWAFRGQGEASWPLSSALTRYLDEYINPEHWGDQERRILRIFKRKAHLFLDHIPADSDTFQWLAFMQHHGAPTRLLDFTWSPYVAAFFALERTKTSAAVWALNPKYLKYVPDEWQEYERDKKASSLWIGEPFVMNQRLIAQSGTFVLSTDVTRSIDVIASEHSQVDDLLVKFELPRDTVRNEGMRALFMMNITHSTLFPGLDGLARSLAYELEFHYKYDPRK